MNNYKKSYTKDQCKREIKKNRFKTIEEAARKLNRTPEEIKKFLDEMR